MSKGLSFFSFNSFGHATWVAGPIALLVGAALFIGFLTPIASAVAVIGNSALSASLFFGSAANTQDESLTYLELVVMSIALVLLGPGAFSLDARLFGRREIIIPEPRRTPRP